MIYTLILLNSKKNAYICKRNYFFLYKSMYLGIIYTNSSKFEAPQFFKKEKIENFDINNKTLSIILGKKNSIDLFGQVSVLNKQINDNLFWTYNKLEKRSEFEIDVENFLSKTFKNLVKTVKYVNVNIYTVTFSKVKEIYNVLTSEVYKKITYISKNMLYIYTNNIVYGLSLDEIKYLGINTSKIIDKVYKLKNNEIITSDSFIKNETKKYLKNYNYLIPYLYLYI